MKTAAFFITSSPTPETLIRLQSRLLGLLTLGQWKIIVPDVPCPGECQVINTCKAIGRQVETVGLTARSRCAPPRGGYQRVYPPGRYEAEWFRDEWIIRRADLVICVEAPGMEDRIPVMKRAAWFAPLVDIPGSGSPDFDFANVHGLGKLLVEKLRAAA